MTYQTELDHTIVSDDAIRREIEVTVIEWRKTVKQKDDYAVCRLDNGEVLAAFINADTTFMKPVIGTTGIKVVVRTWRLNERVLLDRDSHWNADFLPVERQTQQIQQLLGYFAASAPTVAEPAPSPSKKPSKATRKSLGRNVQSGSCKPPVERADPLKWSALVNNVGESNRIWRQWEAFQEATGNEIGLSTFAGMCLLEGLDSVVAKYKA